MRTIINKQLKRILKWLERYLISRKTLLSTREAAIYLDTSIAYIYRLTADYNLPYYKASHHLLYFKRKEIDAWLKTRYRIDFQTPTRKIKYPFSKPK